MADPLTTRQVEILDKNKAAIEALLDDTRARPTMFCRVPLLSPSPFLSSSARWPTPGGSTKPCPPPCGGLSGCPHLVYRGVAGRLMRRPISRRSVEGGESDVRQGQDTEAVRQIG